MALLGSVQAGRRARVKRSFYWLFAIVWVPFVGLVALVDLINPFFNDLRLVAAIGFLGLPALKPARVPALFIMAAGLLWLGTSQNPSGPAPARVIVFGVDGATFDVIDGNNLPEFERLGRDGTRAELTSMEPMFSPVLWTTMASGRTADEHGIRGFHVHADDCKVARWWDIAEGAELRVGLYKWLVDYPPRTFRYGGFWVPSWLAPSTEAWPASLSVVKEVELSRRLRRKQVAAVESAPVQAARLALVGVRLSTLLRAVRWSVAERYDHPDDVRRNVEMQQLRGWIDRDVFIEQLYDKAPAVASLTYYATDGLAHLYWDRYDNGGDELRAAYRQADAILGDIRSVLSPEARLLVVSDHGFRAMDGTGQAGQFAPLTERLSARLTAAVGPVDVSRLGHKLVVAVPTAEARALLVEQIALLRDSAGAAFFLTSDIPGSALSLGLTLADENISDVRLAADTVGGEPMTEYVELTTTYTGTHDARGIFYALGPGVTHGGRLDPVPLLSVAPTILAALDLPPAVNMPGKAVIFAEKPRVASYDGLLHDLPWIRGSEGENEEMLKALGYTE